MDFPNLPCLVDGDFKISESSAIPRYVANKSGKTDLLGKNTHDQAQLDQFLGVLGDVRAAIGPLFWDKDWEAKKAAAW
jgi:glutathione S-transferase